MSSRTDIDISVTCACTYACVRYMCVYALQETGSSTYMPVVKQQLRKLRTRTQHNCVPVRPQVHAARNSKKLVTHVIQPSKSFTLPSMLPVPMYICGWIHQHICRPLVILCRSATIWSCMRVDFVGRLPAYKSDRDHHHYFCKVKPQHLA